MQHLLDLRSLSACVLAFVMSGCGGGGGSSGGSGSDDPDPVISTGGQRVSKTYQDLDLNGTTDIVTSFTYNANERTMVMEAVYSDDGVADEFRFGDETIRHTVSTVTFSENGNLQSVVSENTHADGSSSSISFVYGYAGGRIASINQDIVSSGGSISFDLQAQYDSGLLSGFSFDNGAFSGGWALDYLDGLLDTATYSVNNEIDYTASYVWRGDGQLRGMEITRPDSSDISAITTVYSDEGVLQSATRSDSNAPDYVLNNFTAHYIYDSEGKIERIDYDPLSTGTVKASERYEWEDGDCMEFYGFSAGSTSIPHHSASGTEIFPAGVFSRMPICAPAEE